jgi:hypothetical protein
MTDRKTYMRDYMRHRRASSANEEGVNSAYMQFTEQLREVIRQEVEEAIHPLIYAGLVRFRDRFLVAVTKGCGGVLRGEIETRHLAVKDGVRLSGLSVVAWRSCPWGKSAGSGQRLPIRGSPYSPRPAMCSQTMRFPSRRKGKPRRTGSNNCAVHRNDHTNSWAGGKFIPTPL